MGLYPKKLRSVDDLEREKKRLRRQMDEQEQEPLFSFDGLFGGDKTGTQTEDTGSGGGNILGSLMGLLPMLGPVTDLLSGLMNRGAAKRTKSAAGKKDSADEDGGNILSSLLREFAGGYIKWKAMQLSVKLLKHFLRRKKNTVRD